MRGNRMNLGLLIVAVVLGGSDSGHKCPLDLQAVPVVESRVRDGDSGGRQVDRCLERDLRYTPRAGHCPLGEVKMVDVGLAMLISASIGSIAGSVTYLVKDLIENKVRPGTSKLATR